MLFPISSSEKPYSSGESPNPPTPNSDFTSTAKDSSPIKRIAYICGLRARIECEPLSEHSTHSDRVTNIGYLLSSGASPLPAATQNLLQYRSCSKSFCALHCFHKYIVYNCCRNQTYIP